jgi:glycosyltransferase involved in cell wall biosynthesis
MGFGKAMIIPDHTGLVEWLQDGESGTVFINGDVESLMNAMRRLRASKLRPHMEFINRSLVDSWHPHLLQPEYAAALKSSRKA